VAIFLQHLALKLGVATGRDLAQACRDHSHPIANFFFWIGCEIAIAACDLAEVIGSAIALNLLFGRIRLANTGLASSLEFGWSVSGRPCRGR
jgi:NRAMP (natural resistance-associated macrophage protein)-like metal ion transporter